MLNQIPYKAQFAPVAPACSSADSHTYSAPTTLSSAGPAGVEANGNYNLNIYKHLHGEERMYSQPHP